MAKNQAKRLQTTLNPLNGLMVKNQAKRQNLKLKICVAAQNHNKSARKFQQKRTAPFGEVLIVNKRVLIF